VLNSLYTVSLMRVCANRLIFENKNKNCREQETDAVVSFLAI